MFLGIRANNYVFAMHITSRFANKLVSFLTLILSCLDGGRLFCDTV
jgi:hypothetical protein